MTLVSAISGAIGAATGELFAADTLHPIGGGDINQAFGVGNGARRYFVKTNGAERLPMFEAEAAALHALAATHSVRVPQPVCCGTAAGWAFLVLDYLDLRGGGHAARLGEQLAALHRVPQARFGWTHDNWIGSTPQPNGGRTITGSAARRSPMGGGRTGSRSGATSG